MQIKIFLRFTGSKKRETNEWLHMTGVNLYLQVTDDETDFK